MFKEDLFRIKYTIDKLANNSQEELRNNVLNNILCKKLDRNYESYIEKLTLKINYILSRNNYKVIKAINRMKKEEEEKKKKKDEDDNFEEEYYGTSYEKID